MAEDLMASFEAQLEAANVPQEDLEATADLGETKQPPQEEEVDLVTSFQQQLEGETKAEKGEEKKKDSNSMRNLLGLPPEAPVVSGSPEFKAGLARNTPEAPTVGGALRAVASKFIPDAIEEGASEAFAGAKERIEEDVTRLEEEAGEDFSTMDVVGAAGKLVVPIIGEGSRVLAETVLSAIPKPIKDVASNAFEAAVAKVGETELGAAGLEALQTGMEKYEEFSEKHPDIAGQIDGALSILEVFGAAKVFKAGASKARAAMKARKGASRLTKAKQLVAESVSANNQRTAFKEGRLTIDEPSKLKEFLLGTKRPEIKPSPRAQRGIDVLYNSGIKVPTKPGKLFNAAVDEGVKRAEALSGDMQKINIDDAFRKQIKESTEAIRSDIINNDKLLMSAAEKKKLAGILDEIDSAETLNDVWKGRIKYDLVQPEAVKGVSTASSDMNVFRNSVWKDTRGGMNDLMDSVMDASGQPGLKDKFTDMSSLFEMQENILQRVPEFAKQKKGILSKSNLFKLGVGAAGVGGVSQIF